jgi:hypothetical protein
LSRHRHRRRFEAYLDKVFGFSDLVSALPEGRQFPQPGWKKVFDAVFLGAAIQIPSLLQIEADSGKPCHGHDNAKPGVGSDSRFVNENLRKPYPA